MEVNLSSPSGIIHGHLIVLVRLQQDQIDGSEDEEMNINNIEDYEVESSDEDPFDQESNSETESETSISDESEIKSRVQLAVVKMLTSLIFVLE